MKWNYLDMDIREFDVKMDLIPNLFKLQVFQVNNDQQQNKNFSNNCVIIYVQFTVHPKDLYTDSICTSELLIL